MDDALGLGIGSVIDLGDQLISDLDPARYGIGWWSAYPALGRQERILISDYLISCGRDISTNLCEAYTHCLELDHAVEDFKEWIKRGVAPISAPRSLYEDLAFIRVSANLTAAFRAIASALDCLGTCIIGIAGLPVGIVKADLSKAKDSLQRSARDAPRLRRLFDDLNQSEAAAGPRGWARWLLDMRNMLVHRGRRVVTYSVSLGNGGRIDDFRLILPRAPELTEVQAWIYAGGHGASSFEASASTLLSSQLNSACKYANDATALLLSLWRERRANPGLVLQPPEQWKKERDLINPVPQFSEPPTNPVGRVRGFAASDEVITRLKAAAFDQAADGDIRPSLKVWSSPGPTA